MASIENFDSIHDMITCPYDKSHQVGASRFASHVVKCRQQHPKLAKVITICEFNQLHHVPIDQMQEHLRNNCREYKVYQYQIAAKSTQSQGEGTEDLSSRISSPIDKKVEQRQAPFRGEPGPGRPGHGRGRGRNLNLVDYESKMKVYQSHTQPLQQHLPQKPLQQQQNMEQWSYPTTTNVAETGTNQEFGDPSPEQRGFSNECSVYEDRTHLYW